jgi:hypothetical protein
MAKDNLYFPILYPRCTGFSTSMKQLSSMYKPVWLFQLAFC